MAAHGKNRIRTKPNDAKNRLRRGRPKVCVFCAQHIPWVDYKDTNLLRRFMSDRGRIKARANTGTCRQHQRGVALAIKTARELAMLPYLVRTLTADKSAGRGGRGTGRPGERPPGGDDGATPPGADETALGVAAELEGDSPSADMDVLSANDDASRSGGTSH
jgi:ribosomal protein S18